MRFGLCFLVCPFNCMRSTKLEPEETFRPTICTTMDDSINIHVQGKQLWDPLSRPAPIQTKSKIEEELSPLDLSLIHSPSEEASNGRDGEHRSFSLFAETLF